MAITLDITGFYYSISVPFTGQTTVEQVLAAASNLRNSNGGVLSYVANPNLNGDKFVSQLTVIYDQTPKSRQDNSPFGPDRPMGPYSYNDDVLSSANRIGSAGNVPGLLAWQYYVFDETGVQKNNERMIIPVSGISPNYQLADGYRIVWRLVGIFGLNQFIDGARESLVAESKGQPVSLKQAGQMLRKNNRLMSLK